MKLSSLNACQRGFKVRYKFVNFIFVRQGGFLNGVTLDSFVKRHGCSSSKGIPSFSVTHKLHSNNLCGRVLLLTATGGNEDQVEDL